MREKSMLQALEGKRILVIDDEPDVCQFIALELSRCTVDTAGTYERARELFAANAYDAAVIDIMGVRGYELLAEFSARTPCIMLTGRALTAKDLKRSMESKAVLYLPKEELGFLDEYIAKVLVTKEPLWSWLFRRLDFRRWFGRTFQSPVTTSTE
jgi:CheY-like chemotaxis protein